MPVIKPILSFTLFLLLRRGVLFFIREKIYMLKAPCSRNKHDFGRTFQKTVWRRLSVRQSCGASVAVQGRERGRRCRLSSDKPRRNTRRRGEQAPFRAAELWRRRIFGAAAGFASFCGGNLRVSSGRGTCADGRCAACGRGEHGASRGSDGGPAARISDGCALLGLVHRRRRREALSERENLEGGRATGRCSSRTGCRKRTGAVFAGRAAAETSALGRHVRSRGEGAASPGMGETPGALCSVWRGARRVRHLERGDVRRRGTGVQQEMRKTRKSGARRRACGAGRACTMTCSRKSRAVLP